MDAPVLNDPNINGINNDRVANFVPLTFDNDILAEVNFTSNNRHFVLPESKFPHEFPLEIQETLLRMFIRGSTLEAFVRRRQAVPLRTQRRYAVINIMPNSVLTFVEPQYVDKATRNQMPAATLWFYPEELPRIWNAFADLFGARTFPEMHCVGYSSIRAMARIDIEATTGEGYFLLMV